MALGVRAVSRPRARTTTSAVIATSDKPNKIDASNDHRSRSMVCYEGVTVGKGYGVNMRQSRRVPKPGVCDRSGIRPVIFLLDEREHPFYSVPLDECEALADGRTELADVRIDTRGVPKGPVYEEAPTVLHRQALTAADATTLERRASA